MVKIQNFVNAMVLQIPKPLGLFRILTCTPKSLDQMPHTLKCIEAHIGDNKETLHLRQNLAFWMKKYCENCFVLKYCAEFCCKRIRF